MNKKWILRGLIVLGAVYAFALIPANIRPQWTASPLRKPNQTITVKAGTDYEPRVEHACRTYWMLRPLLGSAQEVRMITTTDDGQAIQVDDLDCELYVT